MFDQIFDRPAFDVLDAALYTYLPGLAKGWLTFRREAVLRGLVVYHLSNEDVGDLGTITLRMLPDDHTEMSISDPPRPRADEVDKSESFASTQVRRRDLHKQRRAYKEEIVERLFDGLALDLQLIEGETSEAEQAARAGVFRRSGVSERAEEVHRLITVEKLTLNEALAQAKTSYSSYKRWLDWYTEEESTDDS